MVETNDVSSVADPVASEVVISCVEVLVNCSMLLTFGDGSSDDVVSATIEFTEVSEVRWSISVVVVAGAIDIVDIGDGCTSTVNAVTDIDDVIGCVSTDDVEGCGVSSLSAVADGVMSSDDISITMLVSGSTVVVLGDICCSIVDVTADVEVGNVSSLVIAVGSSELSTTSRLAVDSAMTDVGVGTTDGC